MEYLSTIVVLSVVAGMLSLAARSVWKRKKQGKSCGCSGCGGCVGAPTCHAAGKNSKNDSAPK